MQRTFFYVLGLYSVIALAALGGCGSDSAGKTTNGVVTGPADTHCTVDGTVKAQPVGMCVTTANLIRNAATATSALTETSNDAGDPSGSASSGDYGVTLYGDTGYDDDCKYTISFTDNGVKKGGAGTIFTVTTSTLSDGKPASGVDISPEVFLSETHPAPSTGTTVEAPAGVYKIGPVVFDMSGRWTVRYHLNELCSDGPADSPHGHAAFYIDVP